MIDQLDRIKEIDALIKEHSEITTKLIKDKGEVIKSLQAICPHPKYMIRKSSIYFDDEYSRHDYTKHTEKCDICNKVTRKYTKYSSGDIAEEKL